MGKLSDVCVVLFSIQSTAFSSGVHELNIHMTDTAPASLLLQQLMLTAAKLLETLTLGK